MIIKIAQNKEIILRSWRKAKSFKIDDPELALQVKVSKMLGLAFALSITGIGGLGSLVALILGVKANRIIRQSNGRLSGGLLAWWCILAGAVGTMLLAPTNLMLVIKQLR